MLERTMRKASAMCVRAFRYYRALVVIALWDFANGRKLEFNEVVDTVELAI